MENVLGKCGKCEGGGIQLYGGDLVVYPINGANQIFEMIVL